MGCAWVEGMADFQAINAVPAAIAGGSGYALSAYHDNAWWGAGGTDGSRNEGAVDAYDARMSPRYYNYRKASIYAGSNEIQRNIIAKMTLGL